MSNCDWKDKSDAAASWTGILIVVIGGLFGLVEYFDKKDQWRTEKTMAIVERLHKAEPKQTIQSLEEIWIANRDKIFQAMQENAKKPQPVKDLYSMLVIELVESKKLQMKIFEAVDIYEEVAICASHEVCSISITLDMLGKEMTSFYNRWRPFISHYCKKTYNKRYAANLAFFVELFSVLQNPKIIERRNVSSAQMRRIIIKQWANNDRSSFANPVCIE